MCNGHAVWKGDAIGDAPSQSIMRHQRDDSRTAIDVSVATAVHDNFVPNSIRDAAQIGVFRE